MVFALVLVHTGDFFQLTQTGGWKLELQAFFLVSALVVALTAPKTGGK
jgi:putative oxidoreductase